MNRIRRLVRRFAAADRGATAVEFSIVAIPLMLTLLGSVEFGRMLWVRQSMSEVAIISARCMGLPQTECAASSARDATKTRTYAIGVAAKWGLTLTSSSITIDSAATCGGAAGFSKVTITRQFNSAVPVLISQLADNPMTVSACFPNGASG